MRTGPQILTAALFVASFAAPAWADAPPPPEPTPLRPSAPAQDPWVAAGYALGGVAGMAALGYGVGQAGAWSAWSSVPAVLAPFGLVAGYAYAGDVPRGVLVGAGTYAAPFAGMIAGYATSLVFMPFFPVVPTPASPGLSAMQIFLSGGQIGAVAGLTGYLGWAALDAAATARRQAVPE